ncbi:hypothetical protein EJ08DRAFT_698364 [Tothia fuscella]|uniref:Uncharacterized protein n=1 Tax=Tothia fuscella TaxID=1048955 RepID=A0A9P4NP27_9PEZI|nr:hypothetical protein EJ08DRAFT_698364 [Tothia fuscella]
MSHHICGCYYIRPVSWAYPQRYYLPQVSVKAHTSILATTSRTILTQNFVNPSDCKGIKELRYTFPLYDGVTVVGFTCRIGDRVIVGEVKEKDKARAVYKAAVESGQTAGLLEQLPDASDVFTTTIGNVPPGATILVDITYLGELKHDAEVDGIRFIIPTSISPRYGSYPGEMAKSDHNPVISKGFEVTVDATLGEGSWIREMRSPSHPIAVSVGTTSKAPNADPQSNKASATLSLGSAELAENFVLQIVAKETSIPKAILESHPTIPGQRALMATLVPKFALPSQRPEIVFVCDRSGSMSGSNIVSLRNALKVFLKSLPVGVKFNICSFGSRYTFLWKKSQAYSQTTLEEAMNHVDTMGADYGGTEMFEPIKETLKRRYSDMSLEVFLVTDGEIWDQQRLFSFLNEEIITKKAPIRVFTLGIGSGASSALIEGVARAGNGFAQTVGNNEKLDGKVVRMLKGSLSPHINDYTIDIKYGADPETDDEEFELIERVMDSLKIHVDGSDDKGAPASEKSKNDFTKLTNLIKKPISLFDTSADVDAENPKPKAEDGQDKYSHLPAIESPRLLQAPNAIPPLFAFSRTSVYLLMSPNGAQKPIKSVVLRGTSSEGPLELEIPVQTLEAPGETIHQLAAKKAVHELEQGRGWLYDAKDEAGKLIKDKFPGRFDEMVEREAVRLGVQFQVSGKFCSFVAVEKKVKSLDAQGEFKMDKEVEKEYDFVDDDDQTLADGGPSSNARRNINAIIERGGRMDSLSATSVRSASLASNAKSAGFGSSFRGASSSSRSVSSRSASSRRAAPTAQAWGAVSPPPPPGASSFGSSAARFQAAPPPAQSYATAQAYGAVPPPPPSGAPRFSPAMGTFGPQSPVQQVQQQQMQQQQMQHQQAMMMTTPGSHGSHALQDYQMQLMLLKQQNSKRLHMARQEESNMQTSGGPIRLEEASPALDMDIDDLVEDPATAGMDQDRDLCFDVPRHQFVDVEGEVEKKESEFDEECLMPQVESMESMRKFRARGEPLPKHLAPKPPSAAAPSAPRSSAKPSPPKDPLQALVELQTFEGFWEWSKELCAVLGADMAVIQKKLSGADKKVLATALAVRYFEVKLTGERDSWELVVEKAKGWLEMAGFGEDAKIWEDAKAVIV